MLSSQEESTSSFDPHTNVFILLLNTLYTQYSAKYLGKKITVELEILCYHQNIGVS